MIGEMGKFAEQDAGELLILFLHAEVFDAFVQVDAGKGDEKALFESMGDRLFIGLQMDKAENSLLLVLSTVAKLNE